MTYIVRFELLAVCCLASTEHKTLPVLINLQKFDRHIFVHEIINILNLPSRRTQLILGWHDTCINALQAMIENTCRLMRYLFILLLTSNKCVNSCRGGQVHAVSLCRVIMEHKGCMKHAAHITFRNKHWQILMQEYDASSVMP